MAVEAYLPSITVIVITALIDSINPCAIGVLVLMLSVLLSQKKSSKRMLALGSMYIFAIFLTYFIAGLGLLYFLTSIPLYVAQYIAIGVSGLVFIAGIIEIKDYFWYGQGFTLAIPVKFSKMIKNMSKNTSMGAIFVLGAFVAAVELPCTGAPYLAIITLLSQNWNFVAFLLLILYNIIFIAPLVVILIMVVSGSHLHKINKWKQLNKPYMRLATGVLLIAMAWLLILIANGTINFG